jgi:hypothetical protein
MKAIRVLVARVNRAFRPSVTSSRTRRRATAAVLAASFALSSLVAAPAAQAALGDLACTGAFQLDIDPPLTPLRLTSTAYATGEFTNCLSPNGNYAGIQSGAIATPATVSANGSALNICQLLLTFTGSNAAASTFVWQPSAGTSHYTWRINTDPTQGQITFEAALSSGPMAGDKGTAIPVLVNPNPDCAINGLKYLTANVGAFNFG